METEITIPSGEGSQCKEFSQNEKANFLLFSMQSADGIKKLLENFVGDQGCYVFSSLDPSEFNKITTYLKTLCLALSAEEKEQVNTILSLNNDTYKDYFLKDPDEFLIVKKLLETSQDEEIKKIVEKLAQPGIPSLDKEGKLRTQEAISYPRACSATVLWSGEEDRSVPVQYYIPKDSEFAFGIVLHPDRVTVEQADDHASGSERYLTKEGTKPSSKHPNKVAYGRPKKKGCTLNEYATNLARYDIEENFYYRTGSIVRFAKNIHCKYIKHKENRIEKEKNGRALVDDKGIMKLNEALTYQKHDTEKGSLNPIDGLLLVGVISLNDAGALLTILQKHPHLKLYFYDIKAKSHIVRYLDNEDGQIYLKKYISIAWKSRKSAEDFFKSTFLKATPFKGYDNNSSYQKVIFTETSSDQENSDLNHSGVKADAALALTALKVVAPQLIENYETKGCCKFFKTFGSKETQAMKKAWETTSSPTEAILLIFSQLDKATQKYYSKEFYYGQDFRYFSNFSRPSDSTLYHSLKQIKKEMEKNHKKEIDIYHIIYATFHEYLNRFFKTFDKKDLFGTDGRSGYAKQLFEIFSDNSLGEGDLNNRIETIKNDIRNARSERKASNSTSALITALDTLQNEIDTYKRNLIQYPATGKHQ